MPASPGISVQVNAPLRASTTEGAEPPWYPHFASCPAPVRVRKVPYGW
jgi:hypothetical protein